MTLNSYDHMVMQSAIATLNTLAWEYESMRNGNRYTEKHYRITAERLTDLSNVLESVFRRLQESEDEEDI